MEEGKICIKEKREKVMFLPRSLIAISRALEATLNENVAQMCLRRSPTVLSTFSVYVARSLS
jgi:hypothetical protein